MNGETHSKPAGQNPGVLVDLFDLDRHNALAHAIVATIREPLIVLDRGLRVVAASGAFYRLSQLDAAATQGCFLHELNGGQWNIPGLRELLDDVFRGDMIIEGHEIEMEFPDIGRRRMLLNARLALEPKRSNPALLVALEDVTARHEADELKDLLLLRQTTLALEIQHRTANSLQIIASILTFKIRTVASEEARMHLRDARQRVMAVATVQQQLRDSDFGDASKSVPICRDYVKAWPGR